MRLRFSLERNRPSKHNRISSSINNESQKSLKISLDVKLMDQIETESKRLRRLKKDLIEAIPRFPNNKTTLLALQAMKLTDLLVAFLNWKVRLVGSRPRSVKQAHTLNFGSRAAALRPNIEAFLDAVRSGADLTHYLSLSAKSEGFTPADRDHPKGLWADKDFLLNIMGFHHFHLGLAKEPAGHYKRTDDVLFALVSREEFEVIGLFTHDAFEHDNNGEMTLERRSLWAAHEKRLSQGRLPCETYIGGMAGMGVTGSGAPVAIVNMAFDYVRRIKHYEKSLVDFEFAKTLYSEGNIPAKSKFVWSFDHLDLVLLDEGAGQLVRIAKGPN
ncbi:hypothetical protein SAMN05444065_1384 [Pseudomonas syringae]|uniref:Uncharacterized protein n=2 Tax=Pseudomonas syringae TaxID=317 RepID=A0AB38C1V5_PSESX|nr:hypothetical protein SAMN05444065_1384 [Pseudomonas syringae]SFP07462.1 hypothetical protein SAMN05444063_1534 [Pseudomonas syringae]